MKSRPATSIWIGAAFCLSAVVIAARGADPKGIGTALFVTGRLNFLLFWLAYAGGAMASLFGDRFEPLRRRTREFGLAFASALLVHLGLVAWLCAMGAAPGKSVFVFFGIAAAFVYLIALFSIRRLQLALGARGWWLLRTIGLNYVAYAFAVDFLNDPLGGGPRHVLAYMPFAVLAVVGPGLRFAAFVRRVGTAWRGAAYRSG
jgi:hypothetical protein